MHIDFMGLKSKVGRARALSPLVVLVALCGAACGDDGGDAASDADAAPLVGVLELPVSLRTGDAAPGQAYDIQLNTTELRVDGKSIGQLAGGSLPAEVVGKLAAALSGKQNAALQVHASAPYAAVSALLSALSKAGVTGLSFKVRKASGTDTGWLTPAGFGTADAAADDADVGVPGAPEKSWADFEAAWEAVYEACGGSDSGNCAYKPAKIAQGGKLKTVLYAAGQGVNVNFYRTGAPPPEEPAPAAEPAKTDKPTDPAAEVEDAPPATQALFQFRAKEAQKSPSAITGTLAPLCGSQTCGVIVRAEAATPMMRLISLLGAAFPDGGPAPRVLFEL